MLSAVATRAPTGIRVDSRPQAILKLRPRNSIDYRVRYEPQIFMVFVFVILSAFQTSTTAYLIQTYK